MLRDIAVFETKYQITSPVFIAVFAIFFLLTFGGVTVDQIQVGSTSVVNVNAPAAIATNILIWSVFGLFIPTAFLVSGVLRDAQFKIQDIFYTTSVKEKEYLFGRFIGGYFVTLLAFSSVPLAIMIGAQMPWLDPENVGPFVLQHFLYHFFVFGAVNLLVAGLIMFTIANVTRSNIATYTGLVALLILYFVGIAFANQPEFRQIAALMDPFGFTTYGEVTRYWTAAEQNTLTPPIEGVLLWNRLIWLGIAAGLFILNVLVFSFRRGSGFSLFKRKPRTSEAPFVPTRIELPQSTPVLTSASARQQFASRVWFEVKGVVLNVAFWVLLALGIFNSVGGLIFVNSLYGTPNYPVTRVMIDILSGSFAIVPIVVVIYYSAELIWRERSVRFNEIVEATPAPSWAFVFSKFIAMCLVLLGLISVSMLTSIIIQLFKGYANLELDQYVLRLMIDFGIPFILLAALAVFAQVVTNNRWLGMLAVIIVFIASLVMANMGFEHNLYQYGGAPGAPYSDMNGYGHFLGTNLWFYLYWGAISGFLLIMSYLLWNRGSLTPVWRRVVALPRLFTPATSVAALVMLVTAAASGTWIYYNTNVRNEYVTTQETERRNADFERKYRNRLVDLAQPTITDVSFEVDIFPSDRRYTARGEYVIDNKTDSAIDMVWVAYGWVANVKDQSIDNASIVESDTDYNVYAFKLDRPMRPGETKTLSFEVEVDNPGFRNSGNVTTANYNGTFFNNGEAMPGIGLTRGAFMQDRQARRRQGLDPIDRAYPLEDESRWNENGFGSADFVNFRSIVSTSADQIAIAPGYLEREWREGDRRYFEYVMDAPILNFYSWLSAEYEVVEDKWNEVLLQIFYHKGHEYNLDRMMEAMKESFDYFTTNLSPFQYRQMRIMEFPSYQTFAQSFPNTVPFSESIGFIADIRDPDNIDYVYYVTAHELAHQWWAHQVMAANVQGATMLIETFSQYSALMVMKQEYGEDHMRRFLKYELDNYLSNRGAEQIEELPLYRVENQQYIHYRKGSVVMYALQDYLGEDTVNRALSRLIELRAFQSTPYATTLDFLQILREEAGPEHEQLIHDLFERIVIYDLKADEVEARETSDGRWEVTIDVEAKKFVADGAGVQIEEAMDLPIDIGIFTENLDDPLTGTDHILFMEKRRINERTMQFQILVDQKPLYAGIDPYNKLIDRNSDDNIQRIDIASE